MVVEVVYFDPCLIFPTAAAIPPPEVQTRSLTASNSGAALEVEEADLIRDRVEVEGEANGSLSPGLGEVAGRGYIAVADYP